MDEIEDVNHNDQSHKDLINAQTGFRTENTNMDEMLDRGILESLAFPEMHNRRHMIGMPDEGTCQWVFDTVEYQQWNSNPSGLLWIKGVSGSELCIVLSFFCNATGTMLARTNHGLFRSLLCQLFLQDTSIRDIIRQSYREKSESCNSAENTWQWQLPDLRILLWDTILATARRQQVVILVDALDETEEREGRNTTYFFHSLSSSASASFAKAKICLSSRHYPILSSVPALELHVESYNRSDIREYVQGRLGEVQASLGFSDDSRHQIVSSLADKAQGVFLWARIVVQKVVILIGDGGSPQEVEQMLSQVPNDLKDLYENMFASMRASRYMFTSMVLLKWASLAIRPLSVTEMRYAIATHGTSTELAKTNSKYASHFTESDESMKRLIAISSGGLIEVKQSTTNSPEMVQLVHFSVRDFMLGSGTIILDGCDELELSPTHNSSSQLSRENLVCRWHGELFWSCLRYLATNLTKLQGLQHISGDIRTEFPFIEYVALNALGHAGKGRNQRGHDLEKEFRMLKSVMPAWVSAGNIITEHTGEFLFAVNATVMHFAAAAGLEDLAIYILKNEVEIDAIDRRGQTALHLAARQGHLPLVEILVNAGANVRRRTKDSSTAIVLAATQGHHEVFKWLLSQQDGHKTVADDISAALHAAASSGNLAIAKSCIDAGANVNLRAPFPLSYSPIYAACLNAHGDLVRLLLENGAEVNAQGGAYGSALQAASASGHENIVQLLLEAGADVNIRGGTYGSAIRAASIQGFDIIENLLRMAGATIDYAEDSDVPDDLSDVSSVESVPSLTTGSSLSSSWADFQSNAARLLTTLLCEDRDLHPLYIAAVSSQDRQWLSRNHDRLLKQLFKDLRVETESHRNVTAVRVLRQRDRRIQVTRLVQQSYGQLISHEEEMIASLREQKSDTKHMLERYFSGLNVDEARLREEPADDEARLKEVPADDESGSSSEDSDEERTNDEEQARVSATKDIATFIRESHALSLFKKDFGYSLKPPTNLADALSSGHVHVVRRLLSRDFTRVARADFAWLHELRNFGYTDLEIAKLLLEEEQQAPWISHQPEKLPKRAIQNNHHAPKCVHHAMLDKGLENASSSQKINLGDSPTRASVIRQIESLCGFGGVTPPSSGNRNTCNGSVSFDEKNSNSRITYADGFDPEKTGSKGSNERLLAVLTNLCTAVATAQSVGLCCNSFTILFRLQNHLELRRIPLFYLSGLTALIKVATQGVTGRSSLKGSVSLVKQLLTGLLVVPPENSAQEEYHFCSLATQFLCIAFLSYVQAHVGPIAPFFLDTPQRKIILLGNHAAEHESAIFAELVDLTCLSQMVRQPVLAFSSTEINAMPGLRYDVWSSIQDCLDTWGPGHVIYQDIDIKNIEAIAIGGGFIVQNNEKLSKFHWAKEMPASEEGLTAFDWRAQMVIGSAVVVNTVCPADESLCRSSSYCALEPLGTRQTSWEALERQGGLQGGFYAAATYVHTWHKIPGITLKEVSLQRSKEALVYCLDQNWGLQVSFCTSVANRVPLRKLIADLVETFVNPLDNDKWQQLRNVHNINDALAQADLFDWLKNLSEELRSYSLTLFSEILMQLRYTGVDCRNGMLVVAWPKKGDLHRGLRIPCRAQTHWAEILADAEDCATFAYVTPVCLETGQVKCRGELRAWQNMSKLLVTEISPSKPEGQPVSIGNPSNTTHHTNSQAMPSGTLATGSGPILKDHGYYYFKKLDTLLWVKVERQLPQNGGGTHLIVGRSGIPSKIWRRLVAGEEYKKHCRIRERQAAEDHAEFVIVRSNATSS